MELALSMGAGGAYLGPVIIIWKFLPFFLLGLIFSNHFFHGQPPKGEQKVMTQKFINNKFMLI